MEEKNKRLCKRCFLEDFAPEEYIESMKVYLQGLDDSIKVEDGEYRRRLSKCKNCSNLLEGICRICGCFVEYRAAIKVRKCPDLEPRW